MAQAVGSQEWVISKIKRWRQQLWDIPEQAVTFYNSIDPAFRLPINPRTTANMINCYVLDEAKKAFDGVSASRFEERNGTTYQHLNGCSLWYKQLGEDGLPSNYPTHTALSLMQGGFPWAPRSVLLVVGFELDALMQSVQRVEIQRYTDTNTLRYAITLSRATNGKVLTMPTTTGLPTKTKISIRRGPEQEELKVGEE